MASRTEYIALDNKSALNDLHHPYPFRWDLNIYRGCEHGCKYCYAIYSHDYLEDGAFFDRVYYKKNILSALEKELSKPSWKQEAINIGGVTDSYQPIESKMKLMRDVLKLMIKYKTPVVISTKSVLILRDLDLIDELSKLVPISIDFTITTADEEVRKKLEPNGSPSIARFKAIQKLKKTNAVVGVHIMPIIPYLTDSYENLDALYRTAKKVGVDYVLPGALYLRGKTKPYFLNFIKENYPQLYPKIKIIYQKGKLDPEYKKRLNQTIQSLKDKYQLTANYQKPILEKEKQITKEQNITIYDIMKTS